MPASEDIYRELDLLDFLDIAPEKLEGVAYAGLVPPGEEMREEQQGGIRHRGGKCVSGWWVPGCGDVGPAELQEFEWYLV